MILIFEHDNFPFLRSILCFLLGDAYYKKILSGKPKRAPYAAVLGLVKIISWGQEVFIDHFTPARGVFTRFFMQIQLFLKYTPMPP